MRVAYLLTQDRGGPVDVTVRLAAALQASGEAEVKVFGPVPARDAHLVEHEEISVPSKGDLRASRQARAALRAWRPDVVHAQDRRSGLVCAGLGDIPVVHTYHGVPDDVGEPWFRGAARAPRPSTYAMAVLAADALVARRVDRTVVPAPAMGKFLRERLRVPAHRIAHIDNCVPIGAAEPPTAPVRRLLFAGLLVERKGLPTLLEALPGALPPDATLTVAGDGPLRARCEQLAEGLPVEFLGFRADVPELLRKHDALVLPSTMEQQPLVVAEAMAAGKPVVATDTGGVPDMLDVPGTALRLARPGDVTSLTKQLRALFADPDPAHTGRLLAARANERFSPDVCARRHLELYRGLS
ncbi:glycosyltransferase involved in cell wall biosynthesis [Lentzea atacamensis]|uniref:Glycosyltransferase involved in cell wall biosynthesis n=1 Tax=Lentzea atacamensis TaxID=531938 RepID=A0A316IM53_9PSEU|nr:glycosyltransferase family 4 protein [Lentzea atacamensis]PWK91518.1 glycosyltransferase involved in cell wall biosynthesis [Lentzea atacamensis]RAS63914.1 glycosyltransferase involved in cell wall biosynthesis [Lentzea atacamensis]